MPVDVVQCWGFFRPGEIHLSTDSPSPKEPLPEDPYPTNTFVPRTPPIPEEYQGFQGSTRDGWSPARVRAAEAAHSAWQLAAQKALAEESAAAASKVTGPEPGATYGDIRVYTRLKNGQYKYWGIKDDDNMTIEEFWTKNDPENTRDHDTTQGALVDLVPAHTEIRSNSSSPRIEAAPVSRNSQKAPEVNPKHRVRKPTTVKSPANKSTRKSLASKIYAKHPGLAEQVRDISESTPRGRRSAAHPAAVERSDGQAKEPEKKSDATEKTPAQPPRKQGRRGRPRTVQPVAVESVRPEAVDQRTSEPDDAVPLFPPKRKRGRPATKDSSTKSSRKQKRPAAENKATITKPKQKKERSSAPSSHKMYTRARGGVDHLQLT